MTAGTETKLKQAAILYYNSDLLDDGFESKKEENYVRNMVLGKEIRGMRDIGKRAAEHKRLMNRNQDDVEGGMGASDRSPTKFTKDERLQQVKRGNAWLGIRGTKVGRRTIGNMKERIKSGIAGIYSDVKNDYPELSKKLPSLSMFIAQGMKESSLRLDGPVGDTHLKNTARGLYQLRLPAIQDIGRYFPNEQMTLSGVSGRENAGNNVRAALLYHMVNLKRGIKSENLMAAYNAGPTRISSVQDGKGTIPKSTKNYVNKINTMSNSPTVAGFRNSGPNSIAGQLAQETAGKATGDVAKAVVASAGVVTTLASAIYEFLASQAARTDYNYNIEIGSEGRYGHMGVSPVGQLDP